jgi:hypothetical protein
MVIAPDLWSSSILRIERNNDSYKTFLSTVLSHVPLGERCWLTSLGDVLATSGFG